MWKTTLLLVVAGLLASGSAVAAPRTVAVAYFDNNTGKAELDPLRKGLADMLITDLAAISSIQVVEREKLNKVLDELELSRSKFIDPKTAQQLGKGLAAEYILTGHYVLVGEILRIDARVVHVATARVAATDTVEGPQDEFFSLEKDLVELLIRSLDLRLGSDEKRKLRANPTQSFGAWSKYSAGLDAADRGEDEKARALFEAALALDPNYAAARTRMGRLKVVVTAVDQRHGARRGQILADVKKLNPKSQSYAHDVQSAFMALGHDAEALPHQIELLTWFVASDLYPVMHSGAVKSSPVATFLGSLASSYMKDPLTVEMLPAVFEYLLTKYPDDVALTATNMKDLPRTVETAIRESKDPEAAAMWKKMYAEPGWHKQFGDNRPAAHKLFALIASKLRK